MSRATLPRAMVVLSLVAALSGHVAGQSSQRKPIPKKPAKAAKTEPATKPAPAADIRIRTRYISGAQASENTTCLKGARQRVEFPGIISIEQCDLGRTVLVNPASKTYLVKQRGSAAPAAAVPPASPPGAEPTAAMGRAGAATQPKGGVVTYITTLTDTGERKQMFGHEARRIATTVTRQATASACDKSAATVEIDGWYIDVSAADRCPVASAAPAAGSPAAGGCTDRVEKETRGDAKLGFPIAMKTTTRIGEGDRAETTTSSMEVTAFEMTTLDGALFDVPAGYTEAHSTAELMSGSGSSLADALLGSTADGTASAAPKTAGTVRIGVLEPVDKSAHNLPTRELHEELAADLGKAPFEALALRGASPEDAQADAARMQCDYVLYSEIASITTSKPGRVGSVLKKVSRDGPPADIHEVRMDYRLYPVGAGAGATALSDTAKATSGGGFDLHSALHVAMFAGSLYMRFTGLGFLSPTLMANFGGGLGPLAGTGLFDPRMSAISSMTQLLMNGGGALAGSGGATATAGSAEDAEAAIRQTVHTALANTAKGTIEHLQKKRE